MDASSRCSGVWDCASIDVVQVVRPARSATMRNENFMRLLRLIEDASDAEGTIRR
jgi:hypothetical protein